VEGVINVIKQDLHDATQAKQLTIQLNNCMLC